MKNVNKLVLIDFKEIVITFDGSCYVSLHTMNNTFGYDYVHVNSLYKTVISNRIVKQHTIDSFIILYDSFLLLPFVNDEA